jgi:broad specificity phosphatase PhoE
MDALLFYYKPEVMNEIGNNSFKDIAKAVEAGRYTYSYAKDQLGLLIESLEEVEEEESVLVISHGYMIEIGLVAMFPSMDHEKWGDPFHYLEGYRVGYENGEFKDLQILRTS